MPKDGTGLDMLHRLLEEFTVRLYGFGKSRHTPAPRLLDCHLPISTYSVVKAPVYS